MSRMRMMPEKGTRSRCSLTPRRTPELIVFFGEEHVEAGERSVAAADVALQLDLHVFRQVGGVDLLFERAQPVAQHHDLVKEGFDRHRLLLQLRVPWPQNERAATPLVGGRDR